MNSKLNMFVRLGKDPVTSSDKNNVHGETFYINFYYSIFQFMEERITLRIFVSKNTNLYNNDMKLLHSL